MFGAELADHQMGPVNRGFLLNVAALHALQTRAIDYFAIFDIQRLVLPGSSYRFLEYAASSAWRYFVGWLSRCRSPLRHHCA